VHALQALRLASEGQKDEWTTVAGTQMYAAVWGQRSGPTVVCVHGLGASHRYFLPFGSVMAEHAQVVAPDLPGFGRTPGPKEPLDVPGLSEALAAWLRASGRGGSVLVANSLGCQVVVDLAAHSPELLGPVVLNAPTTDSAARTAVQQAGRLLLDVPLEGPSLYLVLAHDSLVRGPRRFARTLQAMLADRVETKLGAVATSAVGVRGSLDPVVSRSWAHRVADGLPHGEYIEVPWSGHALNWSRPRALADVVVPLLTV
jgi:pimeloyl-ACP methyl ester carboxylesterase